MKSKTIEQEFNDLVEFYATQFQGKEMEEILSHGIFDNMGLLQKKILIKLKLLQQR